VNVSTYSQARQRFAEVHDTARREEVRIKRRTGDCFTIQDKRESESPFEIPSVKIKGFHTGHT
jgi:hypothetical protein